MYIDGNELTFLRTNSCYGKKNKLLKPTQNWIRWLFESTRRLNCLRKWAEQNVITWYQEKNRANMKKMELRYPRAVTSRATSQFDWRWDFLVRTTQYGEPGQKTANRSRINSIDKKPGKPRRRTRRDSSRFTEIKNQWRKFRTKKTTNTAKRFTFDG